MKKSGKNFLNKYFFFYFLPRLKSSSTQKYRKLVDKYEKWVATYIDNIFTCEASPEHFQSRFFWLMKK